MPEVVEGLHPVLADPRISELLCLGAGALLEVCDDIEDDEIAQFSLHVLRCYERAGVLTRDATECRELLRRFEDFRGDEPLSRSADAEDDGD